MKLYSAPSGRNNKKICQELGVGVMVVAHYYDVSDYPFFAVDNGCFSAYNRGVEWDPLPFLNILRKYKESGQIPDFTVIPDIVAGGQKSLEFSMGWLMDLHNEFPEIPLYLAVQDGMMPSDIDRILDSTNAIKGLFIGGTMRWKLATLRQWAVYAHKKGLKVHAGRIGPVNRMVLAHDCEIDSIDSTTWVQCQCLDHHVKKYLEKTSRTIGSVKRMEVVQTKLEGVNE